MNRQQDLERISAALEAAGQRVDELTGGTLSVNSGQVNLKEGGDPVTVLDHAVDEVLREILPRGDEGWLSEETVDDPIRLEKERLWVVDPVDGTKELVAGLPEWSISIGLVENGIAVAGGIFNPMTRETFLGAPGTGLFYNGKPHAAPAIKPLAGARVLASRSEIKRGEWDRFADDPFQVEPVGSVAYKLALVAFGLADATWTLVPKSEWDVAAGVALCDTVGVQNLELDGQPLRFNRPSPLYTGVITVPGTADHPERQALLQRLLAE